MIDAPPVLNAVPNQAGARDILMFRGAEYWPTPEAVIREIHTQGLSIRIARNNIPEGMVRGLSRIALGHIKAVMTIEKGNEEDLKSAFAALANPDFTAVLDACYDHAPSRWLELPETKAKREIFEKFGVKFHPGIFAYTYYTGTSYYLKPGEDEAPEDLAVKGVQAVRGIIAATGTLLSSENPEAEREDDEGSANG
jgi:hypothetical protein